MIDPKCFTKAWLEAQREALGCRNPILLEKAVLALELVGRLQEAGLPFQFKGGTSLLLRLPVMKRLSIDVDIVCLATQVQLEAILTKVAAQKPFLRYEHNAKRDREMPPKRHYRLFFESVIHPREDHILLDVLLEPELIVPGEAVTIQTAFIEVERSVQVNVPSIESLLGDKLTAFAPKTVGILYHPERKLDIVKQLYDVAALFDVAANLSPVAEAYERTVAKQNLYRNTSYAVTATLADSVEAAYLLSQHGLRGGVNDENASALIEGIRALDGHLLQESFRHDQARIASGKVALLACLLLQSNRAVSLGKHRYLSSNVAALRTAALRAPWASLQRLRGGNTEAFFYWWKAQSFST
jgi:predicted nucleotidyltransferase component of viral defense system